MAACEPSFGCSTTFPTDSAPASLLIRDHNAWIRFSKRFETPQIDKLGDGRGMAIKLMASSKAARPPRIF